MDKNKELNEAIDQSTYDTYTHSDRISITDQLTYVRALKRIDEVVIKVITSKDILFVKNKLEKSSPIHTKRLGKSFRACLDGSIIEICRRYPHHKFSAYFELLRKHAESMGIALIPSDFCSYEILNDCVSRIREEAYSEGFLKTLDDSYRSTRKNFASLIRYLRGLHSRYSKLLVIRIDLAYLKEFCVANGHECLTYSEVKQDREAFLKYLRKLMPRVGLVGYVWKTEHGIEKSYHHHFMLLFDGQRVREDITIGEYVGQFWNNVITKQKGYYYNCNRNKSNYKNRGVGMICHSDMVLKEGMEIAALYLTKADWYAKLVTPDKSRTFGKGTLINAEQSGRGRPRKFLRGPLVSVQSVNAELIGKDRPGKK